MLAPGQHVEWRCRAARIRSACCSPAGRPGRALESAPQRPAPRSSAARRRIAPGRRVRPRLGRSLGTAGRWSAVAVRPRRRQSGTGCPSCPAGLLPGAMAARSDTGRVGHTRNDQAETVLFRFLRGRDGGLAAIRPVTAEGIVRPLLEISATRWTSTSATAASPGGRIPPTPARNSPAIASAATFCRNCARIGIRRSSRPLQRTAEWRSRRGS